MYKILNINGNDYKLEYSIEASLYADCVTSITTLMMDIQGATDSKDIKEMLKGISNIPQTALTMFYAGLMEAHGTHPDGDGKVPDINAAKRLITQYIKEHQEDGEGNFYSIMEMCINQMTEDGFFNLVGISAMLTPKSKTKKVPQDHQKTSEK